MLPVSGMTSVSTDAITSRPSSTLLSAGKRTANGRALTPGSIGRRLARAVR